MDSRFSGISFGEKGRLPFLVLLSVGLEIGGGIIWVLLGIWQVNHSII